MSGFLPFDTVFLSGGQGSRMGTQIPKQYLPIHQIPLALYSFDVFLSMPEVQKIVVVCEEPYQELFRTHAQEKGKVITFARPGKRRQDSVENGIQSLQGNGLVCIHDAARPYITSSVVRETVQAASHWGAATLGVKMKSTIKICDAEQLVKETPNRDSLWEIQTPQVILLELLKEGFIYANTHQLTVTDDVSLVELIGKPVKVVLGDYQNIKVTTPEDLKLINTLLQKHALL